MNLGRLSLLISLVFVTCVASAMETRELYVFRAPKNQDGFRSISGRIEVYNINSGHTLSRVIPLTTPEGTPAVQFLRGVMIDTSTRRIYVSHFGSMDATRPGWLLALDLTTETPLWHLPLETSLGRPALSPDGNVIYMPDGFPGQNQWRILNAQTGLPRPPLSFAHGQQPDKTLVSLNGQSVYLQSTGLPDKSGSDPALGNHNGWLSSTNRMIKIHNPITDQQKFVGPFRERINSFTINGKSTLAFATVDDLIGFQIADTQNGRIRHTSIPPTNNYAQPSNSSNRQFSHGIAITAHEKEAWVPDFKHIGIHVFSITNLPTRAPKWIKFIRTTRGTETNSSGAYRYGDKGLKQAPGWVLTGMNNKFAYPETGEVIDIAQKKVISRLISPEGLYSHSRFMVEVVWNSGQPIAAGNQTGIGRVVAATSRPASPSNFTAAMETSRARLRWNDVSGESLYNIYRADGQGPFVFMRSLSAGTTNFTDTGLLPSTAYSYQLEAFNARGKSSPAIRNVKTLYDTSSPSAPGRPVASSITDVALRLEWAAATDNIGVVAYQILRNQVLIGETSALSFEDSGLHPSTSYSYTIQARDAAGNLSTPSQVLTLNTATSTSPTPPADPTNLKIVSGTTDRIEIRWQDNAINEDLYELQFATNGYSFSVLKILPASSTNYIHRNFKPHVFTFRVKAVNGAGSSRTSNLDTISLRPPHTPIGLVAAGISTNQIQLAWGWATRFHQGFQLEQSNDGIQYNPIAELAPKAYSFTVSNLTAGMRYYYRIRSFNEFGPSEYSIPDWAETSQPSAISSTDLSHILVTNRTAQSVIVVDKSTSITQQAAKELQTLVRESTGATLSIISPNAITNYPASWTRVRLGDSSFAASHGVKSADLASEFYRIKTVPGNIIIVGKDLTYNGGWGSSCSNSPATVWGVLHLMDHFVGARFLWPGPLGTHIPAKDNIVIPSMDLVNGPIEASRLLPMRFSSELGTNPDIPEVMTREEQDQIITEANIWLQRNQIGRRQHVNMGHAFDDWWDRYYDTRPDYFAVPPPGVPQITNATFRVHLNIGNPAVSDQIIANYQAQGSPNALFVSPNDGGNFCTSPESMALDLPQNQSPSSVWSGRGHMTTRYVRHWNGLLERARALNPNVKINTLVYGAYKYAPFPEALPTPHGFVFVNVPAYYHSDMWKAWSDTQNQVFLRPNWLHTGVNGPHIPISRMGTFIKMTKQNKVAGWYYDELGGFWATQGINYYLIARLGVRPELTVTDIVEEYTSAFGPAAQLIKDYIKYWENYSEELAAPCGSGGTIIQNGFGGWERAAAEEQVTGHPLRASWHLLPRLYPDEVLDPAYDILANADQIAGDNPLARERIQFLRHGLDQLKQVREVVKYGTLVRFGNESYRPQFDIEDQKLRALRRELSFKHVVWGNNQYRAEYRREASTIPHGLTKPLPPPIN